MDAVSYSLASKQAQRIEKFIENPDSNSGVLTQPKVIEAGETITIKSGRQAILADTVVDGDLVIEAGGDVFVPAGAGFNDLDQRIDTKLDKDFSSFTNKVTPDDTDNFAVQEVGGDLKKVSWSNIKTVFQSKLGTDNLFMIQDQKTSGTNGDNLTLGTWKKSTKNTVVVNNISGASVSSSVITLPTGTYYVENEEPVAVSNPASAVVRYKSRLINVSDSTTLISGDSSTTRSNTASNEIRSGLLKLQGLFTISGNKNVELQIYNFGLVGANGYAALSGEVEVYGTLKIWKVG